MAYLSEATDSKYDLNDRAGYLIWTRMQAEAGQDLDYILKRKDVERRAGDGRFFWGVGNAPSTIINSLARTRIGVSVVFSKMKSRPKMIDQNPASTVMWQKYIDSEGKVRPLPPASLVTSRGESKQGKKRYHYALECHSELPLQVQEFGEPFDPSIYRNASGRGAPIGPSQVTSLVVPVQRTQPNINGAYKIDMTAELIGSYWVKLVDPVLLSDSALSLFEKAPTDEESWREFVEELKSEAARQSPLEESPMLI